MALLYTHTHPNNDEKVPSMRRYHRWPLLTATLIASTASTLAMAAPPNDAQVRQFLQVSGIMDSHKLLAQQAGGQLLKVELDKMRDGKKLSVLQQAKLIPFINKANTKLYQATAPEKFEPLLIKVYADIFDADEIKTMTVFYQSSAGKKMMKSSPEIFSKTSNGINTLVQPLVSKVKCNGLRSF